MADCYDCVHSVVKGGTVKCSRTGESVADRTHTCSRFADQNETNVCENCDYYEFGAFSRWNSQGKCKLTGKPRRDDDVACPDFFN